MSMWKEPMPRFGNEETVNRNLKKFKQTTRNVTSISPINSYDKAN